MKNYKVTVSKKHYFVKARDNVEAVNKVEELRGSNIQDDRLSPMTYRKLKEFGYTSQQWKNWNQGQANKIIASRQNKGESKSSTNKEAVNTESNKSKTQSVNSNSKSEQNIMNIDWGKNYSTKELKNYIAKNKEVLEDVLYDNEKLGEAFGVWGRYTDSEYLIDKVQERIFEDAGLSQSDFDIDKVEDGSLLNMMLGYLNITTEEERKFVETGLKYLDSYIKDNQKR